MSLQQMLSSKQRLKHSLDCRLPKNTGLFDHCKAKKKSKPQRKQRQFGSTGRCWQGLGGGGVSGIARAGMTKSHLKYIMKTCLNFKYAVKVRHLGAFGLNVPDIRQLAPNVLAEAEYPASAHCQIFGKIRLKSPSVGRSPARMKSHLMHV